MNENLDLIKILKDCPKGTELYSPIIGTAYLFNVTNMFIKTIKSKEDCGSQTIDFYSNGKFYDIPNAECLLFPSKDNRDWSTFKVPNKLPKTWEEFCKKNPIKNSEYYIASNSCINRAICDKREDGDQNFLPNKEYAEAISVLCQLIQLRDCYNDGWTPDWTYNFQDKFCIYTDCNKVNVNTYTQANRILAFKTEKLRNQFLENFRDLIEIAKPLL